MGPLALGPRVAVLTLMQGFRLHSGSTDAADVAIINMLLFFYICFSEESSLLNIIGCLCNYSPVRVVERERDGKLEIR